jgi:hypothetical protein
MKMERPQQEAGVMAISKSVKNALDRETDWMNEEEKAVVCTYAETAQDLVTREGIKLSPDAIALIALYVRTYGEKSAPSRVYAKPSGRGTAVHKLLKTAENFVVVAKEFSRNCPDASPLQKRLQDIVQLIVGDFPAFLEGRGDGYGLEELTKLSGFGIHNGLHVSLNETARAWFGWVYFSAVYDNDGNSFSPYRNNEALFLIDKILCESGLDNRGDQTVRHATIANLFQACGFPLADNSVQKKISRATETENSVEAKTYDEVVDVSKQGRGFMLIRWPRDKNAPRIPRIKFI